ncbi:hypothetical protein TVAG_190010 [Trichomonas vaginalis G3]|uniref:Uncharacterized protein n=1 Tax=Trichomonas vaginalis (strain ATCC PRA-98 / G3) TaxID=412133 RepID=A2DKD3_TRIV3|nr:ankyrin repeats (many copies)-containing protein [Trichomonas vaginalis G3]EAY19110.1 hypothetical protein TVAG_190010 [Trichomonas vaginalis G3]KAI5490408.1 ankyrin repeats (many copies)-containing protein [Trichomonas vaginalis G3]|eukprot:XP_001580096.1 hypothetical protein [Trichomonas vaginalis G3]
MSSELVQDFEYAAAHIKDYFEDNKLFDTFEAEDIRKILEIANLTLEDFTTLLKQSKHSIKASKLYNCARNAKVSVNNFEEAISILKLIQKYMKMKVLNRAIDIFKQTEKDISESKEKIQKLQSELDSLKNKKPTY